MNMTPLESQRPVRIAHMPGVRQWIDENSKGEEEGLCPKNKRAVQLCLVLSCDGPAVSWGQQSEDAGTSSGVSSTDHLMHKEK